MKRRSRCHSTAALADSVVALPLSFLSDAQLLAPVQHGDRENRDWAVHLARKHFSDPEYPSRETLVEVALTLARLHRPVGQA